jgi:hypothetical protein
MSPSLSLGLSLVCRWFVADQNCGKIAQNRRKIANFGFLKGLNE